MRTAARELRPFVVIRPRLAETFGPESTRLAILPEHRFDPTRAGAAPFVDALLRLDAWIFGERGLAMPRWALYDCAALPGFVCGLGVPAGELDTEARAELGVPPGSSSLVPVSLLVAIPLLGVGRWLVTSLGSAGALLFEPGLDLRTLRLGLSMMRARTVMATAQWGSPELATFARMAKLRVRAAWLPAHDIPGTAVIELDLARAPRDGAAPDSGAEERIEVTEASLQEMQRDIEAGIEITLAGPPERHGESLCAKVRRGAP